MEVLKRIIKIEKKIRGIEKYIADLRLYIKEIKKTEDRINIPSVAEEIEYQRSLIAAYKRIIHGHKSLVDALVFSVIDKWDVKPLSMKQSSGFLSGKKGLRKEKDTMKKMVLRGIPVILNDITTCLKHGDLTIPTLDVPILFEVKTSKYKNGRAIRQENRLDSIQKYLREDELRIGSESEATMRRVTMFKKETNHIKLANSMFEEAYEKGFCLRKAENGVYYLAEYQIFDDSSKKRLDSVISRCGNPPIHMSLNESKYYSLGYYPLSLSLRKKEYWFDVYRGKIMFSIFVDPMVVKNFFNERGMRFHFFPEDMLIEVGPSDDPGRKKGIRVSSHLFGRIGYEFLSLRWFLEENFYKASTIDGYWPDLDLAILT